MASPRAIAAPNIAANEARLLALANRSAPFGGRYGNPWVTEGGMDPTVAAAVRGDMAMIDAFRNFQQPGTTYTVGSQDELLAVLQQLGINPSQLNHLLRR